MTAGEVLLSQARSQLNRQEGAVDNLRTRATAVFSASGVVAALFAPKVLAMKHETVWGSLALSLLVAGAAATVYVLTPKRMTFGEHLDTWWPWLDEAEGTPDRDEALAVGLAQHLDALCDLNQRPMSHLANGYLSLCVAFGLQVAAWVVGALVA